MSPSSAHISIPSGINVAAVSNVVLLETAMTDIDSNVQPGAPSSKGADIVGGGSGEGPGPNVMAASTLEGNKVFTSDGEDVGKISEIMLDVGSGRIAYAVLSSGGFLGMGDKLYAIPWSSLTLDTIEECFRLDVTADRIKNAPGFFKDRWPSMADPQWDTTVHAYYHADPYWAHPSASRPPEER
jgi:sporulation protein YlmC with PRC-barrel domain